MGTRDHRAGSGDGGDRAQRSPGPARAGCIRSRVFRGGIPEWRRPGQPRGHRPRQRRVQRARPLPARQRAGVRRRPCRAGPGARPAGQLGRFEQPARAPPVAGRPGLDQRERLAACVCQWTQASTTAARSSARSSFPKSRDRSALSRITSSWPLLFASAFNRKSLCAMPPHVSSTAHVHRAYRLPVSRLRFEVMSCPIS